MLSIWCQECDEEIIRGPQQNVHARLAVIELTVRMGNAMKDHQENVHGEKEVIFDMRMSIEGVQ